MKLVVDMLINYCKLIRIETSQQRQNKQEMKMKKFKYVTTVDLYHADEYSGVFEFDNLQDAFLKAKNNIGSENINSIAVSQSIIERGRYFNQEKHGSVAIDAIEIY